MLFRSNDFYAICADADEATNIAATSEETAQHILTSVIKAYYNMVYPIVEQIGNGTAQWGTHMMISMAEGGASPVSYTHLDVYKRQVLEWSMISSCMQEPPLLRPRCAKGGVPCRIMIA